MNRKMKWLYLLVVIILMGVIEKNMTYWSKSFFKVILFFILPYFIFHLSVDYKKIKILKTAKFLAFAVLLSTVLVYFVLDDFIDYETIRIQLSQMMGVNKNNFVWIALFITFINAWIEEFFFRGVYYLEENNQRNTLVSASAFAVYHLAIMDSWLSLPLLLLASTSLILVGLVFNKLSLKSNTIYSSYLVHFTANLTINTIAFFFIL